MQSTIYNPDPFKATDPDRIPDRIPSTVLMCSPEISPVLAKLYNKRLAESCFPSCWKSSLVVPVFKSDGEFQEMSKLHHARIVNEMKTFYEVFCKDWSKLNHSLLQPNQHCALANKYFKLHFPHKFSTDGSVCSISDIVRTGTLRKDGITSEASKGSRDIVEHRIGLLNIFTGCRFPPPQKMVGKREGILPYYLLDLSSLLPVLSLNIQQDDRVLDMCSAPGGKAIAMLQLLSTDGQLICNEFSKTRLRRLQKVVTEYIPQQLQTSCSVVVTNWNGELFGVEEKSSYDKVIVDAPCSSERHVLQKEYQYGGWSVSKMKENAQLQSNLLLSALRAAKRGGTVVYSTCTISPLENEEVVLRTLDIANKIDGITACCVGKENILNDTVNHFHSETFNLVEGISNGILVLPTNHSNWGPMYFAKLIRLE